jgi:hypothetical protein
LGHITENGAEVILLWNPSFYEQFCPLVLEQGTCEKGYVFLSAAQQAILRGALALQAKADCADCPAGIDLTNANFSVDLFAQTLLANCEQVGQEMFNATSLVEKVVQETRIQTATEAEKNEIMQAVSEIGERIQNRNNIVLKEVRKLQAKQAENEEQKAAAAVFNPGPNTPTLPQLQQEFTPKPVPQGPPVSVPPPRAPVAPAAPEPTDFDIEAML